MRHFDILTISDFRLPGGTNHSNAEEFAVHRVMGLRTGLVQAHSRLVARPLPWSSPVVAQLAPGQVEPLLAGEVATAELALLRHPVAAESMPDLSKHVRVRRALLIANQPATRPDGVPEYDPVAITEIVHRRLGVVPSWAPIGPIVRRSLRDLPAAVGIEPHDWTNIFADLPPSPPRVGFDRERPRIGRHSRPQPAKWPGTAEEVLGAYPGTPPYDVRILGGAEPAIALLGRTPGNWTVHAFGALEPAEFLVDIDFWVYFHHPEWSEAYGRAIMEALWSGAVVILPEYLRVTFGDAAVYCAPSDVTRVVDEFCRGERDYVRQSAAGKAFAELHSPDVHRARITALLRSAAVAGSRSVSPSPPAVERSPQPPSSSPLSRRRRGVSGRFGVDGRPRALFVTSNGAGMGHLTRMLGVAREVAADLAPVFFSMSQGVSVAASAGFPYEYVPISSALQTKSELWHGYLEDRLLAAIDTYEIGSVIFDGTWPYKGLLAALDQRDVMRVWMRRAMWKSSISPEQLQNGPRFDLIIEPGEHAHAYDVGATTTVSDAMRVAPMTVLSQAELLTRHEARAELGLPTGADRKYVLVTLGAGNINDVSATQEGILAAVAAHPGWEAVLTKAPIAEARSEASVRTIHAFPLAKYTHAFDFAVSAAGYNSFSEWMSGGLPTVWIPNLSTMTDDQDARARWAADFGYGLRAPEGDVEAIRGAVAQMLNDSFRRDVALRLRGLTTENGASAAAELVLSAWRAFQHNRGGMP